MANSYVEYTTAGSGTNGLGQTTFTAPSKFLSINDIRAKGYNGSTWTELTISSRATTTVTLSATPTSGSYSKVRIYRATTSEQLIDFQNGSRLAESDLDTAYNQGLFVAQEVSEDAGAIGTTLSSVTGLTLGGTTSVDNLTASGTVSNANPLANAKRTSTRQNIANANTQELINWAQTEGTGISTNQYTVPSTGKYFIAAHISAKSDSSYVEMKLYKNYGISGQAQLALVYSELPNASGTTDWHPLTFSGIFSFNQNETIALTIQAGVANAKVLEDGGNWSIFQIA